MDCDDAEEAIISADDFRTAIDTCCQNREMKEAYANAPQGARMFLGLLFYQMHFGANADERQIQDVLADIEPELQIRDINYLLDTPVVNESEKQYLRKLRETVVEWNESYATMQTEDTQQTPVLHSHSLSVEDRKNDEYYPQIRKIRSQKIDHEALKRMDEQRRYKEKILDIAKIMTRTVAMISIVCVTGWVVLMTWSEIKKIEQQKQDTKLQKEFNQKIDEMKAEVTSISNALMSAERTSQLDRQRADEMKSKYDELKQTYKNEMERTAADYKSKLDELTRMNEELSAELTHLRNTHRTGLDEGRTHEVVSVPKAPTVMPGANKLEKIIEPKESRNDLLRQLNDNRTEIKDLCKKNPACYINQRPGIFTNLSKRLANSKDRKYSTATNVTLVREKFFCSACKRESELNDRPCCDVSRQVSFNRWSTARRNVAVTEEINNRIDELRSENEALEQKIRTIRK